MDRELSLADYIDVLRRRWFYVVVAVVVCTGLAYAYADSQERLYRSATTVLVTANDGTGIVAPGQFAQQNFAFSNAMANEAFFAQSVLVSSEVSQRLGIPPIVTVSSSPEADILTFLAINADPAVAAELANTYAEVFIEKRREVLVEEFAEVAAQVQEQIDTIETQLDALAEEDPSRRPLEQRREGLVFNLQELSLASQLSGGSRATIITPGVAPTAPFQPNTSRNMMLGAVLGLMVGVGVAFLREFLDDRIRLPEDLEAVDPRLVNLAAIPVATDNGDDGHIISLDDPDGIVAESYRRLRSSIVFMAATQDLQVIQVTSASQSEGKSTTVANLAVALARTGKRVVVVDADLRRPRQHALFGIAASPGITDVLVGTHEPDDVAARPIGNVALAVIPAGSTAPNPAELLSTNEMSDVIDSLAAVADIVLIDSPPLLAVSDALAVSSLVDGTVLVVQGRSTRAKELRVALDALERVDAHVVGAVLNKVKGPDRNYYQDYLTARPAAADPLPSNGERKAMSFSFDEAPANGNGASAGNGKAGPAAGMTKPTETPAKTGTRRSRKKAAEPAVYDADDEDSSVWASRGGR